MTRKELMKYEIASSWLAWLPQFDFIANISSAYIMWKLDRKIKAYNKFIEMEARELS